MRPERWKQVEQILESALERPAAERAAYLCAACAGDDALRREVETLIKSYEQAGTFIDEPIVPSIATAVGETSDTRVDVRPAMIGRMVGTYKLISEIGRGGMGAVYLAMRADNTFHKRVAVKLVKRGMDTDFILRRFRRERQILAALNHPNIAALLDGGSTEDGLPYFVMEYIEGQPIHRFCNERRLTLNERLRLMEQVCAAVSYAHQKQVVHRDIKPGNILVTNDGVVKLLDFGIAKLLDPELAPSTLGDEATATAVRLMTPEYASPEQVRGLPVTPASDVYSLGVLLYELLTGRRPYRLTSRAPHELARIICDEEPTRPSAAVNYVDSSAGISAVPTPESLSAERGTTPAGLSEQLAGNLDHIVLKAMQKSAEHRYASAAELAADIARHLAGSHVSAPYQVVAATMRNFADETPTARSLAVLPLKVIQTTRNLGGDTGERYLGVGVADALVTQLSKVRGLIVSPPSAMIKYADKEVDPFEVGRETDVDYVLDGRIQLAGDAGGARMRVTAQLVSLRDRALVWAAQFEESFTDILSVQDAIAAQVAEAVATRFTGEDRARLSRRGTDDPRAYEAYLRGRYHWHSYTVEGLARALVHFNEAISIDPEFAAPYAGIAEYNNRLAMFGVVPAGECFAAAKDAARRAVLLDETLPEAWAALAFATLGADWDAAESLRLIHRALELNPRTVQAHEWHALILAAAGRTAEAVDAMGRAIQLDSESSALHAVSAYILHLDGQQEASLRAAERSLALDANSFWAVFATAMQGAKLGHHDEAIAAARRLHATSGGHPMADVALSFALAAAGRRAEAREPLARVLETARESYLTPQNLALIYAELGEPDEALNWVEKGVRVRDVWTMYFGSEPWLADVKRTPRGRALLERVPLFAPACCADTDEPVQPATRQKAGAVASPQPRVRRRAAVAAAVVLVSAAAMFAGYKLVARRAAPLFQAPRSVKLTTTGNAVIAAVSPDGKYVAYVTEEAGWQSLWVRQTAVANSMRIVPPVNAEVRGLTFSRDGGSLLYVVADRASGKGTLYEIAAIGGAAKRVKEDVDSGVGLSPDGKSFAFVRHHTEQGEDDLIVSSEDGASERQIATRKFPDHFSTNSAPAWASDGTSLAVVIETADKQGFFMKAAEYRLEDGRERPLTAGRWMVIDQMVRLPEGGWLMAAQDADSPFLQLWSVAPDGRPRRLTNDMGDYKGVSLSADLGAMVSVSRQTLTNMWVARPGMPTRYEQITSGAGRYWDIALTPDDRVLYASDASSSADIWERQIAGSEQRQLTAGAGRNYGPTVSPDGRTVVFHSNRSGNWQLWRMNRDGSDQRALTSGDEESNWPAVSPNSKWVVYEHTGVGTQTTLWKMPLDGGAAVRLTSELSVRPAISPDGKLVACWHKRQVPGAPWRVALVPMEGGEPVRFLNIPPNEASGGSALRWTPDGRGIVYIDYREGTTSLWLQPLDGGEPQKLLISANEIIYAFDIARDGRIVMSRGLRAHDVVLFTDANKTANE